MIAEHLEDRDFVALKATNRGFWFRLGTASKARVRRAGTLFPGILFRLCAGGTDDSVHLVEELVREGCADPNHGLAIADSRIDVLTHSKQPGAYGFSNGSRGVSGGYVVYRGSFPKTSCHWESISVKEFCVCNRAGHRRVYIDVEDTRSILAGNHGHASGPICCTQLMFPLHIAAACGHTGIAAVLLRHGAFLEAPGCRISDLDTVQELLPPDRKHTMLELKRRDRGLYSPLQAAISHGKPAVAALLLRAGASTNLIKSEAYGRVSPLHIAASVKGTSMIKFCIQQGQFYRDEVNFAHLTPAWIAYINENWRGLIFLHRLGASIDHDVARGFTPLTHALLTRDLDAAMMLIHMGADLHVRVQGLPKTLWYARDVILLNTLVDDSRRTALRLWLRSEFIPPFHPNYGTLETPFDKVIEFLLFLGKFGLIDVDEPDEEDGMTLATLLFNRHWSKFTGHTNNIRDFFLDQILVKYPWRPLMLEGLLGELGADPMCQDPHGNTLLELAQSERDAESIEAIEKYIKSV